MSDSIRVVLVDDQELFRSGVRTVVDAQSDMVVVGEAANGREAIALLRDVAADVVLMDIRMPVMDGVGATTAIFDDPTIDPKPRVIVLTTFSLDAAAVTAIRKGASGFLLKDATPAFLCGSIRAVHAGSAVLAPNELSQLFSSSVERAPRPPAPEAYRTLTAREVAVFQLAARGLSNAEIAAEQFVTESTVKTQISSVLSKLGLHDRVQLVMFANDYQLS